MVSNEPQTLADDPEGIIDIFWKRTPIPLESQKETYGQLNKKENIK